MSLMDFIKKQFIDVIHWTESGDDVLVWRFPTADMEIQYGASLTVRESQAAVFVNEGQVADVFGPGLYKLTTQTLPVLTNLKHWDKLFESPFKSEVYFFSTRSRIGRRWGTPQAVTVRDQDFGAVQVRAFGQYAYRIVDPKKLMSTISGTRDAYRMDDVEDQLRGTIVTAMATSIGKSGVPFLDLAANQTELGRIVREAAQASFAALGLSLESFELMSLSLPEALQEALDKRIRMGMLGNLDQYTKMQAADAIPIAAGNEGGVAGLAAQMAVGLGMGQAVQQGMAAAAVPASALPAATAAAAGTPAAAPAESPEAKLAQLKSLLDKGLIDQADYDAAKKAVLSKLTS
ncbi:SPFH domain-containing protein [Schlegelella sp. S2-27]|uniref:SPFH domain-containing protein n=1 Tax=Caldimonas mangrovi TaxID=2944811 RepID=A0ABT0YJQ5_9BURK|nr:SPFH domain-containing protein [Caldimonas mangrovi]MCM5678966.1 SPFH domain-containing protein [Caldimonas mangrovi]